MKEISLKRLADGPPYSPPFLRQIEEEFLKIFEEKFKNHKQIYHPWIGKIYSIPKKKSFRYRKQDIEIDRLCKKNQIYRQSPVPQNAILEIELNLSTIFKKKNTILYIIVAVLHPLEECLIHNQASKPVNKADFMRFFQQCGIVKKSYFYLLLFAPTFWENNILSSIHIPEHVAIMLVDYQKDSWQFHHHKQELWQQNFSIFDPEEESEKERNVFRYLQQSPRLAVKGGYLILEDIATQLQVHLRIVQQASEKFALQDEEISIEQVDHLMIIKRKRLINFLP